MMGVAIDMVGSAEVVGLRHAVLRAGLERETAVFAGDVLATSRHWAARDEAGRVVGCLTLHLNAWDGEAAYQLRGMAVSEEWRGRGVGRRLLQAAEAWVGGGGVRVMWCNARLPAVGFYEGAGWKVASGEFEVPTAGMHVRMVKRMTTAINE